MTVKTIAPIRQTKHIHEASVLLAFDSWESSFTLGHGKQNKKKQELISVQL